MNIHKTGCFPYIGTTLADSNLIVKCIGDCNRDVGYIPLRMQTEKRSAHKLLPLTYNTTGSSSNFTVGPHDPRGSIRYVDRILINYNYNTLLPLTNLREEAARYFRHLSSVHSTPNSNLESQMCDKPNRA